MSDINQYLDMQRRQYHDEATAWSLDNKNPVVGSYDHHNAWPDYDEFLFKNVHTYGGRALEYGCGPARNIIRFHNRFESIDGVDISQEVINKAIINLEHNKLKANIILCDGKSIPHPDESYHVVFSTICLQHIASYTIRLNIFKECLRVLKPGGHLCFQMGFGGKSEQQYTTPYYNDNFAACSTNGGCDVALLDECHLMDDLINKVGFIDYSSDIRPVGPGDTHRNWIFVRCQKKPLDRDV